MEVKMPSIVARDAKAKLIKEFFERDMNQLQKDYPSILEGSIPKKIFFTVRVIIVPIYFG